MNTDVRRAVFCVVMGSEDYLDAFEKLLRLGLKGAQEREIIRVIMHCLLTEKGYNPYYAHLLIRLCSHEHNHKFTLQYCMWDHFREVPSMDARKVNNLAKCLAACICSFSLSLAVLKAVEWEGAARGTMDDRTIFCFRIAFEAILLQPEERQVADVFHRMSGMKDQQKCKDGIMMFLHAHCTGGVLGKGVDVKQLRARVRVAERAIKGRGD
eukprot:CAMPEP_0182860634 /NCGR_PEP_ID=MMETSP0034_2-20130328/5026_1 /TAXON_ID=156128 /ORGANISM="Nephroselmis pyriformis, Strain CCMP717" /LENGTH=210 /DNA_ID=CAMNT_0024992455 /DNA_START=348 /DNA_END=980 /DNA_ORIENTATION=-